MGGVSSTASFVNQNVSQTLTNIGTSITSGPSFNTQFVKNFRLNIEGGGFLQSGSVISINLWNDSTKYLMVYDDNGTKKLKIQTKNTPPIFNVKSIKDPLIPNNNEYFFRVYAKYENDEVIQQNQNVSGNAFLGLDNIKYNNFFSNNFTLDNRNNKWKMIVRNLRTKKSVPNSSIFYLQSPYLTSANTLFYDGTNLVLREDEPDFIAGEENNPFFVVTAKEYYKYLRVLSYYQHPNSIYVTYILRAFPPQNYASLGDIIVTINVDNINNWNNNDAMNNLNIIFVKKDNIYSSPTTTVSQSFSFGSGLFNSVSNGQAITVKKFSDPANCKVLGYIFDDGTTPFSQYGVNNTFLQKVGPFSTTSTYSGGPDAISQQDDIQLRLDSSLKENNFYLGGRLMGYSKDFNWDNKNKMFETYSTALLYDRTGFDNDLVSDAETVFDSGFKTYLNTVGGLINPNSNDWNVIKSNIQNNFNNTELYILFPSVRDSICCRDSNLGPECGLGNAKLSSSKDICKAIGKKLCVDDNTFKLFPTRYCQNNVCITDYKTTSQNSSKINCDQQYITFCNLKDDSGSYYNYYKYPDLCACFMEKNFLQGMCEKYRTTLGINSNNTGALEALGINLRSGATPGYDCTTNCLVNPMCRAGARVPYFINPFRAGRPIVFGSQFNKAQGYDAAKCLDTNLCVQDVFINTTDQNKIDKIEISQTNNCKTSLQRQCIERTRTLDGTGFVGNVVYGECNIQTRDSAGNYVYKKKIIEDTSGKCGEIGTEFICAIFGPRNDKGCQVKNDGTFNRERVFEYDTSGFKSAAADDVRTALNHLHLNETEMNNNNPVAFYDPVKKIAQYKSECKDCKVEYNLDDSCVLTNGEWKNKGRLNKITQQPTNGGVSCSTLVRNYDEFLICNRDIDCIIDVNYKSDIGCINGSKRYTFDIQRKSNANGKTCENLVKDNLPSGLVNPIISLSNDKTNVIVSTTCEDCETDYVVDTTLNEGRCALDISDGKYKITKVGKIIKPAVGNGVCPPEKLRIVGQTKTEECSFNQDCSFYQDSFLDECDDTIGIRTRKYLLKDVNINLGKTCDEVKTSLRDTVFKNSDSIEIINNELVVTDKCEKSEDCSINWESVKNVNCNKTTGIQTEEYSIVNKEKLRGKDCINVTNEHFMYDNTYITSTISGDRNKIIVTKVCRKYSPLEQTIINNKYYAGVVLIVVIFLIIYFILN